MGKGDIIIGHADIKDFAYWINERHRIYIKRQQGEPKPWTHDVILRDYKFTNAFRELDKGTLSLREMVPRCSDLEHRHVIFNIVWYRMFNRYEHAKDVGFCWDWEELNEKMRANEALGRRIFTSAHMTVGRPGEAKIDTMLKTLKVIWNEINTFTNKVREFSRLEEIFEWLLSRPYCGIGPFIGYEIVTDLRHYGQLWSNGDPSDRFTWVNLGPGCVRGLKRLGYEFPTLGDVSRVYEAVLQHLESYVQVHLPLPDCRGPGRSDPVTGLPVPDVNGDTEEGGKRFHRGVWPPLELREIEHSLCEFDKYQRVKTGVGRPRQKFNGRA